ncbi:hypothetical protein SALBM311S_11995 [Streptomyces alboniger]
MAERQVAVLGGDGNNDTAPSAVRGVAYPVHVLAVHAMGLHLLDHLRFEDLTPICAEEGRWSFLCVIAPLRLPTATGSPPKRSPRCSTTRTAATSSSRPSTPRGPGGSSTTRTPPPW